MARWLKKNPIVTLIGIAATIFAFVKGIPPAWSATMELFGKPDCFFYGTEYGHSSGSFKQAGGNWIEYPPYDGTRHFEFRETHRNREHIYLLNLTPRRGPENKMILRLPVCGGTAQWSYQNPQQWIDLYTVWKL